MIEQRYLSNKSQVQSGRACQTLFEIEKCRVGCSVSFPPRGARPTDNGAGERDRERVSDVLRAPEREQLKRGGEETAESERSSELEIDGARTRAGLKRRKAEGKSEQRWPVRSAREECWRQ